MPNEAWLFDAYPHPTRSCLVVWVKHGSRTTKRLVSYWPEFCVAPDELGLDEAARILRDDRRVQAMRRDRTALWLRGPEEEVLRIQPKRFQDAHRIATDLRRKTHTVGLRFFDVDHDSESRWTHANGLFHLCRLQVGPQGPELRLAEGEDRWSLDYPDPGFSAIVVRVEVQQGGLEPAWNDPLAAIRVGDEELVVPNPGDAAQEAAALVELGRRLQRLDPDVILTRRGDAFDIPYLLRLIRKHRLEHQVWLGREPDGDPDHPDQAAKSIHTYGRWLHKSTAYYLRGRWHIDLSKKTLDSEDDRRDLHGIIYLARTSNRRAQDVSRNGAGYALQQMQIDEATDRGVALPWKRNLVEDWKDLETLCAVDRGGQIMVPEPGLYEDVASCDFSGYYPSLVVRHNLSSDTINCSCCPDGDMIPELGYHVCRQHKGHQSLILERLWPHRRYVKAILRKAKAQSVDPELVARCRAVKSEHKALGVVCFGYFRYRNARFGCAEIHQAIQAYGRDGMTRARIVAQRLGFRMVHTLTDCAFLQKPGVTRAQALHVAAAITKEVGVPMDVEGIYSWLVLLPSKTHSSVEDVGVPNRYYGKFENGELKVRGIEVQRHSTPTWIFNVQQAMLDVLAEADDAQGFRARIPAALALAKKAAQELRERRVPASELGVMVQATRSVEEYQANTITKSALRALRDGGVERKPGQYVQFVVARKRAPWRLRSVPTEMAGRSGVFGKTGAEYDVEHYVRLLARSVETLLSPFGYVEERVVAWLLGRASSPKPNEAVLQSG